MNWKTALTAFSLLVPAWLSAQDQYRVFAPYKDVALLVDVSRSVKGDSAGHASAKTIIHALVSGKGVSPSSLGAGWQLDANPEMQTLFGAYLGFPLTAGMAEPRPLMTVNNHFLSMRIGRVQTVVGSSSSRKLNNIGDIPALVDGAYPSTGEMNDNSTCFWFAMARAAETLSQHSKLGYYLFVVSDEEDDPDYRKDGPPDHSHNDYKAYQKELAQTYPESAIRAEINRYFEGPHKNSKNVELYKPRGDFKQTLIARFTQRGTRTSNKVALSWYAMGVVPQRILLPRVLAVPAAGDESLPPKTSVVYQRPDLDSQIEWLGGLGHVPRKDYNYTSPLLVWQVRHAELNRFQPDERPSVVMDGRTRPFRKHSSSSRHDSQTLALPEDAQQGNMTLFLRHGSLDSEDVKISIHQPGIVWLYILACISAVLALAVFFLSWSSLRQPVRKKKSKTYA